MINTFSVIGGGTAVLHAEWLEGKQLTTTVFYLVGSELRADHYCDFGNQPRYTAQPAENGSIIKFSLREVTNLEGHPRYFHSTIWHFIDAGHLSQDWEVVQDGKPGQWIKMEFTRKANPAGNPAAPE